MAKTVGIKTAIIVPIVGIKFKINAINPHKTAPCKPKYWHIKKVKKPVIKLTIVVIKI